MAHFRYHEGENEKQNYPESISLSEMQTTVNLTLCDLDIEHTSKCGEYE